MNTWYSKTPHLFGEPGKEQNNIFEKIIYSLIFITSERFWYQIKPEDMSLTRVTTMKAWLNFRGMISGQNSHNFYTALEKYTTARRLGDFWYFAQF